jgi:Flp pilus assembly protein TadG
MKTVAAALVVAALLLAGCGGDRDEPAEPKATPSSSATPSATPAATEEPAPDGTVVDVTITDGTVTPQGGRVEVTAGEPVTLRVTSDAADELHVHSDPEHSFEVEPGDAQDFTFTVDVPGQVAVEAHHLDVTVVQLVVRP